MVRGDALFTDGNQLVDFKQVHGCSGLPALANSGSCRQRLCWVQHDGNSCILFKVASVFMHMHAQLPLPGSSRLLGRVFIAPRATRLPGISDLAAHLTPPGCSSQPRTAARSCPIPHAPSSSGLPTALPLGSLSLSAPLLLMHVPPSGDVPPPCLPSCTLVAHPPSPLLSVLLPSSPRPALPNAGPACRCC